MLAVSRATSIATFTYAGIHVILLAEGLKDASTNESINFGAIHNPKLDHSEG